MGFKKCYEHGSNNSGSSNKGHTNLMPQGTVYKKYYT